MASEHASPIELCVMCAGADPAVGTPLQQMLPDGQSRFIAQTARLAAFPTFGCFVPGYILLVPRRHVTSFGCLDSGVLTEAAGLAETLAARIEAVYEMPVLGFEYGNNVPGGRRIEHAHWHLLPSQANLRGWLDARYPSYEIGRLADLPSGTGSSYITVRDQEGRLTVYPMPNRPAQRVRLRRLVAELDPRVDHANWDWAAQTFPELIRRTVSDLSDGAPCPAGDAR